MKTKGQIRNKLKKIQKEFAIMDAEYQELDKYFTTRKERRVLKEKMKKCAYEFMLLKWILK